MSDADAMERAARQSARSGTGVAAITAVALALMIKILRDRQASAGHNPADAQTVVQRALPEVAGQLIGSPHWRELATVLDRLGGAGVDVEQFLSWARPLLVHEHTQAQQQATPAQGQPLRPVQAHGTMRAPAPPAAPIGRGEGALRGLMRRVTDPSGSRGRAQDLTTLGVSPPVEAWAVLAAYSGAGYERANALIESRQWPQIAADMYALGLAGGDVTGVLRGSQTVWQRQAGRVPGGADWPATALTGLGSALQQTPLPSDTSPAGQQTQPGQAGRAPDTVRVATQPPAATAADATVPTDARTADAPSPTGPDLSPVFNDGLTRLGEVTVAHQRGVAGDARVHLVDDGQDEALSTGISPAQIASRGR